MRAEEAMPRIGPEPKPEWSAVPDAVQQAAEDVLGARVRRAQRAYGGYGPTPTYRLRLSDGSGAFFKAVYSQSGEFALAAHRREERLYRELGPVIADWSPAFRGSFALEGWQVILLEDLGPKTAPPWTPALARKVAHALAAFHTATLGVDLPDWLPSLGEIGGLDRWTWQWARDQDAAAALAGAAGAAGAEARAWLDLAVPVLAAASKRLATTEGPCSLLHRDVRSDNMRWVKGRLRLFDWPHAGTGHGESDAVEFAQTVTAEGGVAPEQVIAWYGERAPVRAEVLDAHVAAIAGYLAYNSWQESVPGLPRLRAWQRRQLHVCLPWAARRLGLPEPAWLAYVADKPVAAGPG
jgi:hypothetical protein